MPETRRIHGLTSTLAISLVAKFAIFAISVAIMGILSSRTQLPACGSSATLNVPIYAPPFGNIEAYTDYRDLYLRCLVTPFLSGHSAYNLPIVYNYPPLFLYTLAAFALENLVWVPGIPLVLFDALTVIPLYLIARDFLFSGNTKLAFAVSLVWIFNPINMFYNDLMWLNPGPTTFFLVLSIYLLLKHKLAYSAVALAVATGFKQTAVLVAPIFLIWMIRSMGFSKKILAYAALYISLLFLISSPYIFQDPQQYFWALQIPIFGNPPGVGPTTQTFVYDLSQPTRLTTFIGLVRFADLKSLALATYSVLNYLFIASYVILLARVVMDFHDLARMLRHLSGRISRSLRSTGEDFKASVDSVVPQQLLKREISANDMLIYCLVALLLFFSFFGRGVYKYYFAGITPLALPLFATKRGMLIFTFFDIALLFIPREATPWFAILLITLMPGLLTQTERPGSAQLEQPTVPPETPAIPQE